MINEVAYAAHWKQIHEKEDQAKTLYSMLDQLYCFDNPEDKDSIVMKIKNAYLRDKVLTREEYNLVKMYVEQGYVY